MFGDQIGDTAIVPDRVLAEGRETIDGITYEFEQEVDGESEVQLVARLPEQGTLAAFDLVFPAHVHLFTVAPFFDHWIEILERHQKIDGYDRILVGHGEPVDPTAIAATIGYLRDAKAVHASSTSPEEYAERLKTTRAEREQPGWIDFSSLLLYGVI